MQGLFPRGFAKVWLGAYGGIEETLWNFIRRKHFFFIKNEINKLWSEHKNTLKFRFQPNERSRSDLSISNIIAFLPQYSRKYIIFMHYCKPFFVLNLIFSSISLVIIFSCTPVTCSGKKVSAGKKDAYLQQFSFDYGHFVMVKTLVLSNMGVNQWCS